MRSQIGARTLQKDATPNDGSFPVIKWFSTAEVPLIERKATDLRLGDVIVVFAHRERARELGTVARVETSDDGDILEVHFVESGGTVFHLSTDAVMTRTRDVDFGDQEALAAEILERDGRTPNAQGVWCTRWDENEPWIIFIGRDGHLFSSKTVKRYQSAYLAQQAMMAITAALGVLDS